MKRITTIILLLAMVFGIVSCAKTPKEASKPTETIPKNTTTTTVKPTTTQLLKPTESESLPVEPTEPPEPPKMPSTDEARFYLGEEEGFFFRQSRKYGNYIYEIVNHTGIVTHTLGKYEKPIGEPYNGYTLVQFETPGYAGKDRKYSLVDPYGNLVFEDGMDDIYLIGYSKMEDYPQYFFRDGYVFAYRYLETMTEVQLELGVMNADGTWKEPLSTEHPILKVFTQIEPESIGNMFYYLGEGMVFMQRDPVGYQKYGHYLYDMNTKNFFKLNEKFDPPLRREELFVFEDGVARYKKYSRDELMVEVEKSGEVTEVSLPAMESESGYVVGEVYYEEETDSYTYLVWNREQKRLYVMNSKKGVVKKLESFHSWETEGFTTDSVQITVWNAAGTPYYARIDTNGEYMFEPFVIKDDFRGIVDTNGHYLPNSNHEGSQEYLLVTEDGKVLVKRQSVWVAEFQNGVFRTTSSYNGDYTHSYDFILK